MKTLYRVIKYSGSNSWIKATIAKSLAPGENKIGPESSITIYETTEEEVNQIITQKETQHHED